MKIEQKKRIESEKTQLKEIFEMEFRAKLEKSKKSLESEKTELARQKALFNVQQVKLEEEKKRQKVS